jgi:peptide/nickel transport system permease protein
MAAANTTPDIGLSGAAIAAEQERVRRGRRRWLQSLMSNKVTMTSAVLLLLLVLMALFAPLLAPQDPEFMDPSIRLLDPSADHLMGTDQFGRDVLSRVIYGSRVSLMIGFSVTICAAVIGSVIGLISGYYSRVDTIIMRIIDGLMAFPTILLAIAIMAARGADTVNVFIALTVVFIPTIARLVRGSTLGLKQQPHVESARSVGLRDHAILIKYIYANSLSPLIVQCTFVVALAIISESSLSFLGAGVPPGTPSWGNMLKDGQQVIQSAWWMSIFPGLALVLTVLTLNVLGDGLRDALDPRSRER